MTGRDWSCALFELQKKGQEEEELRAKHEERKQVLESLQQRTEELHKNMKEMHDLHLSFDVFLKDEDADQAAEKAEREKKEVLQKEAEIERLKEEHAELTERKQELQRQVQRHCVYRDFMEQVCKNTKFEDVDALSGYLESLLHFREQLRQRENEAQEQVDRQRKALLTLRVQHNSLWLQKTNQLSQLQTELDKTLSVALTWERKWNYIQETAAKKTLVLGQLKVVTLNLYERTGGEVEGKEGVDMNDTEKQLDQLRMFFEDQSDIVKQHQTPLQGHNKGQKWNKAKKHITLNVKKH